MSPFPSPFRTLSPCSPTLLPFPFFPSGSYLDHSALHTDLAYIALRSVGARPPIQSIPQSRKTLSGAPPPRPISDGQGWSLGILYWEEEEEGGGGERIAYVDVRCVVGGLGAVEWRVESGEWSGGEWSGVEWSRLASHMRETGDGKYYMYLYCPNPPFPTYLSIPPIPPSYTILQTLSHPPSPPPPPPSSQPSNYAKHIQPPPPPPGGIPITICSQPPTPFSVRVFCKSLFTTPPPTPGGGGGIIHNGEKRQHGCFWQTFLPVRVFRTWLHYSMLAGCPMMRSRTRPIRSTFLSSFLLSVFQKPPPRGALETFKLFRRMIYTEPPPPFF